MSKSLLESRGVPKEILTAGPSISTREINFVNDAVSTGWNSRHSDYLTRFESAFAEYVGVKYAMATSSCTGALHLSLMALGIGPGDEVIVPDVTWVATASAVMYTGAKPIFADINTHDWTINLDSIRSLINNRTKAIMPVHLYGYGAAMNQIIQIDNSESDVWVPLLVSSELKIILAMWRQTQVFSAAIKRNGKTAGSITSWTNIINIVCCILSPWKKVSEIYSGEILDNLQTFESSEWNDSIIAITEVLDFLFQCLADGM
jgi:hypothetical protein